MDTDINDTDQRTIWCGNLSEKVTEEILYELFLQSGPLERVALPKDRSGRLAGYAFVTFKHQCSVQYAISLFEKLYLFDKELILKPRVNPQTQTISQNQLSSNGRFDSQQNHYNAPYSSGHHAGSYGHDATGSYSSDDYGLMSLQGHSPLRSERYDSRNLKSYSRHNSKRHRF